ncbi:uncharacterized protein LOC135344546 [Halichondria panicea]|uniref:uncharacterized protein LOC135344546 n=1 Tax=Halichondria panicea TaxID=6063 RepID=UPI00312B688A
MASKLVSTEPTQRETPYLVDSQSEAARSDLESACRTLIFSFIKMKDSDPGCEDSQAILHPGIQRGTNLGASSSTDIASEGSSVDVTDSSVDLLTMENEVHISEDGDDIRRLVPTSLPNELRENLSQIQLEDLKKLYDIEAGAIKIESNELTTVEVVMLHLRSYRNIIKYEISDMEAFRTRFVGFFGSILADLVAAFYPNRGEQNLDELISQDFQKFRTKSESTSRSTAV